MKWTLELSADEREIVLNALRIAIEDGSLYGADEDDEKIEALVESIQAKLLARLGR